MDLIAFSGYEKDIPDNWSVCDGQNGTPDLRERFIVGAGNKYGLRSRGGEKEHILTIDEMPSHRHSMELPSKDDRLDNSKPVNVGDIRFGRHGDHLGKYGKGIGSCVTDGYGNKLTSLENTAEIFENVDKLKQKYPKGVYITGTSLGDCVQKINTIPALKKLDESIKSVTFRMAQDSGVCKNTCSYFEDQYWEGSNLSQARDSWMMTVLYRNEKGEKSNSVSETVLPKLTKRNIKSGNGYFVGPSGNACKDCIISNKTNDLACPESSKQLGSLYSDIYGCGIENCDARYGLSTIEQCNDKCFLNPNCKSFSWAPVGGDKVFPNKNVCTLYSNTNFTKGKNRQIMCEPFELDNIDLPLLDKKFMFENKQCYSHIKSVRDIFKNKNEENKKNMYIKELNINQNKTPTFKQLFDYFKENEGNPCKDKDTAKQQPHNNMPPYYRVIFIMRTLKKRPKIPVTKSIPTKEKQNFQFVKF